MTILNCLRLSFTVRTQVAITKHLKHRNLVTLYEVIDDPSHHTLYLVLEYCERGPLLKAGKELPYEPISEEANRRATRDVLRGLEYLHSVNVVHRDLKPENIVLDGNGTAKLCDFGVSRVVSSVGPVRRSSKLRLTPAWAAPELYGDRDVTALVDCWSLGATIHAASTGSPPVVLEKTAAQTLVKVESGELDMQCTGLLGDLLHGLLERDVAKRFDVATAMGHAWVTDSGKQPLPRTTYVGFSLTQADVDKAINTLESSDDEATTTDLDSAFADVLKVQSESDDDDEVIGETTGGVPCAAWRLAHLQQPGSADEDRVDAVTLSDSRAMLAAYDGHGGKEVVDSLRHTLPAFLSSALSFGTPTSALESAFSYAGNIIVGTQPGTVGACAAVVIVDNDAITCANVGDVAVVLIQSSGAPIILTTKHCKSNDEERKRVESSGAHWANGGRVNGVLRVSRAFGDGDFKGRKAVKAWKTPFASDPVIAMPSISVRKRSPSDALVLVMTDGVVDGFGSECKAAAYIRRQVRKLGDLDKAAKATLDEARARGSKDDLSLLVCDLRDGLVAEEVPAWKSAVPPPPPARPKPEAYDDDFAFDEGVAEAKAEAPPPAPTTPSVEGGSFGGASLKRAERAAARAWSASQPPPAPERFAL